MHLAGSAILDLDLSDSANHGQVSPTLVDVAPDGSAVPIARGHLNLQYRHGVATAEHVPTGTPEHVRARLSPQDQTIPTGHRIGLIVATSNVVWALPDQPSGYSLTVHSAASRLILPVVGSPDAPAASVPGVASEPAELPVAPEVAAARSVAKRSAVRRGRLTVRALKSGRRLLVTGSAPIGSRVRIRVHLRHRRALRRTVRAAGGAYIARFKLGRARVLRVSATTLSGRRLVARARVRSVTR